ncbi:sulfatase [Caproiciproducens sp. NJN-50]|uniref:sulfatase-like hydrolase/transferase n=1 Tax=Caproiciproducens sp. NJN-50 TaxID=2507162 RepID=UPI000FFE0FCD|nr:sulfatase-like hydrolase/transferase [Caproiciproducens sp. NJN-50]QAT49118.1 sulfatase [Caproiciproducens sp. NJN-50]
MDRRPDIIIFNPDQMRADALGHLGNPAAITPNLDRFAQRDAVSFRNAFCQNPVCVPSRCSFATGLYPHVRGHRTMQYLLREGEPSLFSELKDAGYYVWMNARNDLVAGQIPGLLEQHASEIFYGGDAPAAPGPEQPDPRGKPGDKNYYSFYRGKLKKDRDGRNYSSDDEAVDGAAKRILSFHSDRPLCLFLGLMAPHPPYAVEDPYFSAVDRTKLPPRARVLPKAGKPPMEERLREYMALGRYTERDWTELRACYLGMCIKVDEQFQKICDALKAAGRYDNAAIFFFSDHGDYTGDFDLPEKAQNTFENCLTNVPLLIKPPKGVPVDPGVTESVAELVDFYATAMDFAQVSSSHDSFGKSLRTILADRSIQIKQYAFCEGGRMPYERQCDEYHAYGGDPSDRTREYWPRQQAQLDSDAHEKGTMICDGHYKYVLRTGGRDEFYNLKEDTKEERNQIDRLEYRPIAEKMRSAMLLWYQSTCDLVPRNYDKRFSDEMIWHRVKNICPPQHEQAVKEKIKEGAAFMEVIAFCRSLGGR